MQTIEAILDNNRIIFEEESFIPKRKMRVLITFLDDDNSDLIELENHEITASFLNGQKEVFKKDKSLFTNI